MAVRRRTGRGAVARGVAVEALASPQGSTGAQGGVPTLAGFDWSGFPAWAEKNIWIQDKFTLGYVKFKLNKLQWKAFGVIQDQWRRKGYIRQNWLKHRRWGGSILVQALNFYLAAKVPGVECLLMAHTSDVTADVFRRAQLMEHYLPDAERPAPLIKNNRTEIQWAAPHHSAIRIATAADPNYGHGSTRNVFHATEVARWSGAAEDVMVGVLSSIQDAPGTIVIKESTAHGPVGTFYRGWMDVEEGRGGGYENFFVGWLDDETCRWETYETAWGPLPAEDDHQRWASTPREWLEDEERLKGLGATWSQLAWRRQMIPAKCESSAAYFQEQYPATAAEAFLSSGSNVFPPSIVDPELRATSETELRTPAPRYDLAPTRDSFQEQPAGPLRVWRPPERGHFYVVSADTATGENVSGDTAETTKLDYTCFEVIDRWTHEQCAAWHGRKDPDLAAWDLAALGKWYNNALLVPETQHSSGIILVNRLLKDIRYPYVFRREMIDKGTREPVEPGAEANYKRYGWHTGPASGVTKQAMIGYLHAYIRDRAIKIHEPEAWMEMRTFIRAASGTCDAERGAHDDRVMALCIAACVLRLHPKEEPAPRGQEEPPFLSRKWTEKKLAKARARARAAGSDGAPFQYV